MTTILVSATQLGSTRGLVKNLEPIVEQECGSGSSVIYEHNLPACAEYLRQGDIAGLIIPAGHGDKASIWHIKRNLQVDIPVPVLKAYAILRYDDKDYASRFQSRKMPEIIAEWLRTEVLR